MQKLWLVIRHEYLRHVLRRGFLFAVLGMPLILGLVFAGSFFFASRSDSNPLAAKPLGIVSAAGLIARAPTDDEPVRPFESEAAARQALDEGQIAGYAVVADDYLQTGNLSLMHAGALDGPFAEDNVEDVLKDYLRTDLIATNLPEDASPTELAALSRSPDVSFESLGEPSDTRSPLDFLAPFFMGIFFLISIMTTAGYMIQAVVDEKENRTMEILITSITPTQLMSGKILGLIGVGLTQISVWVALLLVALVVVRSRFDLPFELKLEPATIGVAAAWFIPLYVIVGALFAAVGISVTQVSEGREAAGPISILVMGPLYLSWLIFQNPDSPLVVGLSLFPFTSPIVMLTRMQLTDVPFWQYATSWLLLVAAAALTLWVVGRLLRVGMLRYGQRLSLKEMRHALAGQGAS